MIQYGLKRNEWKGGEWPDLDNWNVSHARWPETPHFQLKRRLHPMFTYKFKWMTCGQLQRRCRQIEWQQKIRTARKRRLAYHRDTSLALKIIQHEDFRIHLEVKNTIETLIKIYMHRACGMCRLWNKYGCPEPIRYQTIYSPKFTNSVKIHIQHIMHASQYATSILRTFRWPTQKMITVRP